MPPKPRDPPLPNLPIHRHCSTETKKKKEKKRSRRGTMPMHGRVWAGEVTGIRASGRVGPLKQKRTHTRVKGKGGGSPTNRSVQPDASPPHPQEGFPGTGPNTHTHARTQDGETNPSGDDSGREVETPGGTGNPTTTHREGCLKGPRGEEGEPPEGPQKGREPSKDPNGSAIQNWTKIVPQKFLQHPPLFLCEIKSTCVKHTETKILRSNVG
jgi:hypothetical protein